MDIKKRQVGCTTVLGLAGALQGDACTTLREAVRDAVLGGARHVALDLKQLDAIDAEGLGTLVALHLDLSAGDTALRLVCPKRHVLRLLTLAGIDRVIHTTAFGLMDGGLTTSRRRA